jgi:guanylate kinase
MRNKTKPAALLAVAGPSCVGKDALMRGLLQARPELRRLVTCTTRPPREGEIDGVHYHFLTDSGFVRGIEQGLFLEHAAVHGMRYGLHRGEVDRVLAGGSLPAAIMDVQGVRSVSEILPVVSVGVRSPMSDIRRRVLKQRPAAEIDARLAAAAREMEEASSYDIVIDNLDGQMQAAVATLIAEYDRIARPRLLLYAQPRNQPVRNPGSRSR